MKKQPRSNPNILIVFLKSIITNIPTHLVQEGKPSNRIQHKNNKHSNTNNAIPYTERFGSILKLHKLQSTRPDNSEIRKSHKLIQICESIMLVVIVVLDKVRVSILAFGLCTACHNMAEELKQDEHHYHKHQEKYCVVNCSGEYYVFVVLLVLDW